MKTKIFAYQIKCQNSSYFLPCFYNISLKKTFSRVSETRKTAIEKLLNIIDIINETVGDAISDMLLVETILHSKGWNIAQWEAAYTDLPNRLLKINVMVYF